MCAIAGIFNINSPLPSSVLLDVVKEMTAKMSHRGPDDFGYFVSTDERCILGHRRLSVIDTTENGHQPMSSIDGRYSLVFNGEIYNYNILRENLESSGIYFHTQSDTEVLLKGLVARGTDFITHLDGMFAFAFYDEVKKSLLLARDSFGEKPLYYTFQNGIFAFASELKVLTGLPGFDPLITRGHIAAYLAFQHIPAPNTIYAKCFKLEEGSMLRIGSSGVLSCSKYFFWNPGDFRTDSIEEQTDQLEHLLVQSLKRRLVADVPVGAFLSGGVDSSTAVALIKRKIGREIKTFSLGFNHMPSSEHLEAAEMARVLGTEHFQLMIEPADYQYHIKTIAALLDEPNADSSCVPTYFLAQLAKQHVTVAITGDGGDEIFGGYPRYQDVIQQCHGRETDISNRTWHVGRSYYSLLSLLFPDAYLRRLFGEVPDFCADLLLSRRRKIDLDHRPVLHRLRQADAHCYLAEVLAKVDRMSMAHSLECRTPYLSPEVVQFAASLPTSSLLNHDRGKYLLRRVGSRYIPQDWLNRPKKGFGIDPLMAQALFPLKESIHRDSANGFVLETVFPREGIVDLFQNVLPSWSLYHLWAVWLLELWLRDNPYRFDIDEC